jgi:hypothetical protein
MQSKGAEQLHEREVYAHSLSAIRALGALAVEHSGTEVLIDHEGTVERAWNDFYTRVEEHITTDPEHGEVLYFDTSRSLAIQDGHVVSENGELAVELVTNGYQKSLDDAQEDPRLELQARRDKHDVELAKAVDSLQIGEMIGALSFDPKQAIQKDRKFWEDTMNYREGMAIWQWYYRVGDTELRAGVIAIKRSDEHAMRRAFGRLGHAIPEGIADEDWIRQHVRGMASLQEAKAYGQRLKTLHREEIGDSTLDYSVTDFLQQHITTVRAYFDQYVPQLAQAAYDGSAGTELREFARALSHVESIDWAKRVQLLQIHRKEKLDNADVRLMDTMVTYALVEELRKRLPAYMRRSATSYQQYDSMPVYERHYDSSFATASLYQAAQFAMLRQMVANVRSGTEAGRSYGGCSGSSLHKRDMNGEEKSVDELFGLQDIFGGKLGEKAEVESTEEDKFGALVFHCTEGHRNERKRGELLEKCRVASCKGLVCAPKEEKPKPEPLWKTKLATLLETKHNHERKQLTSKAA